MCSSDSSLDLPPLPLYIPSISVTFALSSQKFQVSLDLVLVSEGKVGRASVNHGFGIQKLADKCFWLPLVKPQVVLWCWWPSWALFNIIYKTDILFLFSLFNFFFLINLSFLNLNNLQICFQICRHNPWYKHPRIMYYIGISMQLLVHECLHNCHFLVY